VTPRPSCASDRGGARHQEICEVVALTSLREALDVLELSYPDLFARLAQHNEEWAASHLGPRMAAPIFGWSG
jgi:hypothetical protein